MFSLICTWVNGWVDNRMAGDLRRHRAHYNVIIMHAALRRDCHWGLENVGNSHWTHEPIMQWGIRQPQTIFRPINHKRVIQTNWRTCFISHWQSYSCDHQVRTVKQSALVDLFTPNLTAFEVEKSDKLDFSMESGIVVKDHLPKVPKNPRPASWNTANNRMVVNLRNWNKLWHINVYSVKIEHFLHICIPFESLDIPDIIWLHIRDI